eukprot:6982815-Prymnesium_polylepis.1
MRLSQLWLSCGGGGLGSTPGVGPLTGGGGGGCGGAEGGPAGGGAAEGGAGEPAMPTLCPTWSTERLKQQRGLPKSSSMAKSMPWREDAAKWRAQLRQPAPPRSGSGRLLPSASSPNLGTPGAAFSGKAPGSGLGGKAPGSGL